MTLTKAIELIKAVEAVLHAAKPVLVTIALTILTAVELWRFVVATLANAAE